MPDGVLVQGTVSLAPGVEERFEEKYRYSEFYEKFGEVEVAVNNISVQTNGTELTEVVVSEDSAGEKEITQEKSEDLPEVPEANQRATTSDDKKRYQSLNNPDSQGYQIRKLIWEEGEITRGEIKNRLNEMGYENVTPGEQHSGVNSALRVLDKVTQEIERTGRGDSKTIRWVGNP